MLSGGRPSRSVDNRPLWTYIKSNPDGRLGACTIAQKEPAVPADAAAIDQAKARLITCHTNYPASLGPLFTEDILDTAVRLETETCSHQPGQTGFVETPAPGQKRVTSMTGIVLDCPMLPDTPQPICREVDDSGNERSFVFTLTLTR